MDPFDVARGGSVARRRWLGALAAAAVFIVSLLVPSAGRAAPGAAGIQGLPAANSPGELARLEARAARLTQQYRGQLVLLTDAESAVRAPSQRLRATEPPRATSKGSTGSPFSSSCRASHQAPG